MPSLSWPFRLRKRRCPTSTASYTSGSEDSPPAYDDPDGCWPPTILVMEGQSIYAESSDTAPLFQLNRDVAHLGRATTEVELGRVKYGMRRSRPAETPSLKKPRLRHVYNLQCVSQASGRLGSLPSDSPRYHIQATSRQTLGHIGLKKSYIRSRYSARTLDSMGHADYGTPQFVNNTRPWFHTRRNGDHWEWLDSEGKNTAVQEESDDQHKLLVTAELPSDSLTTLVALWCCRIWEESAENADRVSGGLGGG